MNAKETAQSISLATRPVSTLESACELAESLMGDHKDLLPAELTTRLSAFIGDLTAVIDDRYGVTDDAEQDESAEDWQVG